MRVTKNGNWAQDWKDENGQPRTSHYRKADIVKVLRYYGYTGEETPDTVLNRYSDAWYLVYQQVAPYRTTYTR